MARDQLYFGYGERTPEAIQDILGHYTECEPAILPRYQLGVQSSADIPSNVRDILAVNRTEDEMASFRAYAAIPNEGSHIIGMVAQVDKDDLDVLDNWDIEGLWFTRFNNQFVRIGPKLRLGSASVHASPAGLVTPIENPEYYDHFPSPLNDVARTKEIACLSRIAFLEER